jgi:hypothetical protein
LRLQGRPARADPERNRDRLNGLRSSNRHQRDLRAGDPYGRGRRRAHAPGIHPGTPRHSPSRRLRAGHIPLSPPRSSSSSWASSDNISAVRAFRCADSPAGSPRLGMREPQLSMMLRRCAAVSPRFSTTPESVAGTQRGRCSGTASANSVKPA